MHPFRIQIAPHAIDRAHCGGVPEAAIPLAARYGESCYYYAEKRVGRTLTRRVLQRLVGEGRLTPAAAERLEGTTVLTQDFKATRLVVTTLPKRPDLGARRYWLKTQRYLHHRNRKRDRARAQAA